MPPAALVVEDEPHIRDLVCLHLGVEGFNCVPSGDGRDALRLVGERRFDLIVLDLMIPGVDGITVCRAARQGTTNTDTPILMLTARREESDKVLGLESGADDYLSKPFGIRELVARVRALMRRAVVSRKMDEAGEPVKAPAGTDTRRPVSAAGIDIDPSRRRVTVRGEPVLMTEHEFRMIYVLASHPGIVFSREALLARVWEGETYVTARSVDTLIKRLRKKIEEDASDPRLILTVWGLGYKFTDAS